MACGQRPDGGRGVRPAALLNNRLYPILAARRTVRTLQRHASLGQSRNGRTRYGQSNIAHSRPPRPQQAPPCFRGAAVRPMRTWVGPLWTPFLHCRSTKSLRRSSSVSASRMTRQVPALSFVCQPDSISRRPLRQGKRQQVVIALCKAVCRGALAGKIKWSSVAAELGNGRTSKQCRERWLNVR